MAADHYHEMVAALRQADKLFREVLPHFNWGASALSADDIRQLNEVPGFVRRTLKHVGEAE